MGRHTVSTSLDAPGELEMRNAPFLAQEVEKVQKVQ